MLEAPAGLGLQCSVALLFGLCFALLNPKTSIFVQKRHPYTANLKCLGTVKTRFYIAGMS